MVREKQEERWSGSSEGGVAQLSPGLLQSVLGIVRGVIVVVRSLARK